MNETIASPDFGVYVHWPFCAAKCPYCDFNSHVRHEKIDQETFARAYTREIEYVAGRCPGRKVTSIFFGGGTPSLMEPATVSAILDAVAGRWPLADGIEITLEANPTSVESDRFAAYRAAGVNRLSLGVQSLDDMQLKFLGRLHSADEARRAIEIARNAFPRISFDMIYARPGQTPVEWEAELDRALALSVDHLSLYQLTIEQGTPFYDLQRSGKLRLPDADGAARMYELTAEVTSNAGLPAYEISNYARPGAECRHNLLYWRYGEYAGIGPGAHGRLDIDGSRFATAARRIPEGWWRAVMSDGHGYEVFEQLMPDQAADELLLMGLRLSEGLSLHRFEQAAGRPVDPARIEFLIQNGLVERRSGGRIRATLAGFLVLDAVIADLAA